MEMDYNEFLSKPKCLLIAPAGFGKTYTIGKCLSFAEGRQLVLTHTHAGVAALKNRVAQQRPNQIPQIETITSYAQKFVLSFYCGNDVPDQIDAKAYYPFLIETATKIVGLKPIAEVIRRTYSGLFVDEYQDCTILQHNFVKKLADILPTRVFGDSLQGIFGFDEQRLVDLDSPEEMGEFYANQFKLTQPWRWRNGGSEQLGQDLIAIRELLENRENIDLRNFRSIEIKIVAEGDLHIKGSHYNNTFWGLIDKENVLVIHPDSSSIYPRIAIVRRYGNRLYMIEAIDDRDFYGYAKQLDEWNPENIDERIGPFARRLFSKTAIDPWFSDKGLKRKKDVEAKRLSQELSDCIKTFKEKSDPQSLSALIKKIEALPDIKCYRKDLPKALHQALREAKANGTSINQAMIDCRNRLRRHGRKIFGKCIGTTLLTKGLEFDNVVILNAHKFNCPKNLYVALTRASRRLTVFTENSILNPFVSR